MASKNRSKAQIDGLSHKWLKNENDIEVAINIKSATALTAYTLAYLDTNSESHIANVDSPHVWGVLASNTTPPINSLKTYVTSGPARAFPQSALEPLLPIKVAEAGRIINGIIKLGGNRVILAATNGEDDECTSDANDETVDVVSDDTSDITQVVILYGKETTTGTAVAAVAKVNGTTEVVFQNPASGGSVTLDEVYGARIQDATAITGDLTIDNVTSSTTLLTMTGGTTEEACIEIATADIHKAYGRRIQVTISAATAADSIFFAGTALDGSDQYEIVDYAASMPLVFETVNRWKTIEWIGAGKFVSTSTMALAGLPTNEMVTGLRNEKASFDSDTGYTQSQQKVEILSDINTGQDLSGGKITILGADSATLRYDEIALTGTTFAVSSNNYTAIYGAWVSEGTPVGSITIRKADDTELFVFDCATYNSAGILVPYKGDESTGIYLDADRTATVTREIPGCNKRPTFTCSNTSATDVLCIYGEDVDGSVQAELLTLVDGVAESIYAWSRIVAIGALTLDADEYVKVSFEDEDDAGMFCGWSVGEANTQSTSTAVQINFKPAFAKQLGKGADQQIMGRIIGTTGYTDIDTIASAARTVTFPDSSGTIALTSGTISITSNIHTVGSGMDYETVKAAIVGATAGDTLWVFAKTDTTITGSTIISKRLNVIGFGDGGTTLTSALNADATIDITTDGCEFHNIIFDHSGNGASDIALDIQNSGAKFFNCEFDGGTNAAGTAINISADGADILEFNNCKVNDGIIDADGNASSILYWNGGIIADNIHLDTGTYHFSDVDMNGTFTTGAAAAASIYIDNIDVSGTLTVTAGTVFNANSGRVVGATTITAVTESNLRDIDFTGAVGITGGTAVVYADDCKFTAAVTVNNAGADFYARGCHFIEGITDAAGTVGILELRDSKLDATTNSLLLTAIGTSADLYDCILTNLHRHNGGTLSAYNCKFEELDQDNGALSIYDSRYSSTGNVATGTFSMYGGTFTGVLTRASGTVLLRNVRCEAAPSGTITGDYKGYNAAYVQLVEGGSTKQSTKFLFGSEDGTILTMGSGGAILGRSGVITAIAWAVGDWSAGAATRGYLDFDLKTEILTVSVPLPELAIDTGTAADLRIGFRVDPTNADDVIDYAVYTQAGTNLVDDVNQVMTGGASEHTHWVNLGALAWSKGDQLVVSFGVFATTGDGNVDTKVYWLELESTVGLQNDVA